MEEEKREGKRGSPDDTVMVKKGRNGRMGGREGKWSSLARG